MLFPWNVVYIILRQKNYSFLKRPRYNTYCSQGLLTDCQMEDVSPIVFPPKQLSVWSIFISCPLNLVYPLFLFTNTYLSIPSGSPFFWLSRSVTCRCMSLYHVFVELFWTKRTRHHLPRGSFLERISSFRSSSILRMRSSFSPNSTWCSPSLCFRVDPSETKPRFTTARHRR